MKVVLVGDTSVGKTCIINSIMGNSFSDHKPTIGANKFDKTIKIDSDEVKISIWDTAGQETYQSLAPIYSRESKAQLLVYAVDNELSFSNLPSWYECIGDSINCVFVVGNKIDKEDDRKISFDDGMSYAQSINATFCEVSAKDGTGIIELFNQVAQNILETNKGTKEDTEEDNKKVDIAQEQKQENSKPKKKFC
ncbi:hypothetical protein M9Y10_040983 [Tritrichomonas musculus]|uniref:Uncharacterized protein n=1 Tax=Tritrichomonas musculus TaxID=1915356 RepID=A0ABR2K3A7_9EUKA